MNRFYSGIQLFIDLKKKLIGACSAVLQNRLNLQENQIEEIQKMDKNEILYSKDH